MLSTDFWWALYSCAGQIVPGEILPRHFYTCGQIVPRRFAHADK